MSLGAVILCIDAFMCKVGIRIERSWAALPRHVGANHSGYRGEAAVTAGTRRTQEARRGFTMKSMA